MQLYIILIKIYNPFVKLEVSLKKIGSGYGGTELPNLVSVRPLMFVELTRFLLSIKNYIYTHQYCGGFKFYRVPMQPQIHTFTAYTILKGKW